MAQSSTQRPPDRYGLRRLRRLAQLLGVVAVFSLILSVTVNGFWTKATLSAGTSGIPLGLESTSQEAFVPDKPAVDLIPDGVIAYETIARQAVPGQGDRAAEGVFTTLDMNLVASVAINVYVRVEALSTRDAAVARAQEMMFDYTLNATTQQLNGITPVRVGYRADGGALAYGWAYERYAVLVKGVFVDLVPAQKKDFLERQTAPVAEAVETFHRTGRGRPGGAQSAGQGTAGDVPPPSFETTSSAGSSNDGEASSPESSPGGGAPEPQSIDDFVPQSIDDFGKTPGQ